MATRRTDEQADVWSRAPGDDLEPSPPAPRGRRVIRLSSKRDTEWKRVPIARRRAVLRAVRSGQLLRDPDDAEALLRATPSMRRAAAPLRHPARMLVRLGVTAWLAWEIVRGLLAEGSRVPPAGLVVPFLYLVFDVYVLVQMRRTLPRIESAEARHGEYLLALGRALPTDGFEPERARQPVRRELLVAFGLCAASVLLFILVGTLAVLHDKGSTLRLVVYGFIGFIAIAFALGASVLAARSWKRARGFERRSEPATIVLVGLLLAGLWAYGMVNVLLHGA